MIYDELKIIKAIYDNDRETIRKDKEYVILNIKDDRFLVKNDTGALEWIHESMFSCEDTLQILVPIKNVVYIGATAHGLTQGTPYSFFKQNSDSYYIFNDSYSFKWYKMNLFKLTSEYKPEHIEEFNKRSQEIEKNKAREKNLKSKKIKLKSEPKLLKANIFMLIAAIIIYQRGLLPIKDIFIASILAIFFLAININMLHKLFTVRKYNTELELRNNESVETARLLSILPPEVLSRLTAVESKINSLSKEVIIGKTFVSSMTGYIINWIKLSEVNDTIPESTSKLIIDYIDSCDRYLDEQYSTVNQDSNIFRSELEKMANKEIQNQTKLMNSATLDLKLIREKMKDADI
jgi:hypothetical protein